VDYNTATRRRLGNCQTGTNAERNAAKTRRTGARIGNVGSGDDDRYGRLSWSRDASSGGCNLRRRKRQRSTATPTRLAHDEIGAPHTVRWNAVSALSVRFETLTIFVPELNKAGASDENRHQFTNENCTGCWQS
jgi:hypothetical protein